MIRSPHRRSLVALYGKHAPSLLAEMQVFCDEYGFRDYVRRLIVAEAIKIVQRQLTLGLCP